jgi:hypothetical protein
MRRFAEGLIAVLVVSAVSVAEPGSPADRILQQYYAIHKSLAGDSVNGVAAAAAKIAEISSSASVTDTKAKAQLTSLSRAAAGLQKADLKSARDNFGELSKQLAAYLQTAAPSQKPYQFYCSMAKKGWLQPDKNTRNPYYGGSMLTCGELVK